MKKLFILCLMSFIIPNFVCLAGLAYYDAGALNSQSMRVLRTHEMVTRAKNKSAIVTTKMPPKTQEQVTSADIKSVVFVNNASVSSAELLNVIKDKINKPMTPENISAIRKDIMRYYQELGFFSAIVIVAAQDTQNGELILEIKEGGRNSITIQE